MVNIGDKVIEQRTSWDQEPGPIMEIVSLGGTVALCRWDNPDHNPKWRCKPHFDRWIAKKLLTKVNNGVAS